jgi:hypothetical protein
MALSISVSPTMLFQMVHIFERVILAIARTWAKLN